MNAFEIVQNKKKNKKITYSQLAEYLGISKQCFSRHLKILKNGRNPFSANQMKKICEYLQEDISIFFNYYLYFFI